MHSTTEKRKPQKLNIIKENSSLDVCGQHFDKLGKDKIVHEEFYYKFLIKKPIRISKSNDEEEN